jgi:hypothetical protein
MESQIPVDLQLFLSQIGLKETPIETETVESTLYIPWKPTPENKEPPF